MNNLFLRIFLLFIKHNEKNLNVVDKEYDESNDIVGLCCLKRINLFF